MITLNKEGLVYLCSCIDVSETKKYTDALFEANIKFYFDSEEILDARAPAGSRPIEIWVDADNYEKAFYIYSALSGYKESEDVLIKQNQIESDFLVEERVRKKIILTPNDY